MRQRAGAGQLQELAGGRRCFLPTKELYGGPSGLSLASGPGRNRYARHSRLLPTSFGVGEQLPLFP